MTRSTRMLWGMLLVAPLMGACGDSLAAPPGGEVGARDLDFVLPELKGMRAKTEVLEAQTPLEPPALPEGFSAARSGGESAYIRETYVTAGFSGTDLWFEYGMSGYGTAWAMTPKFNIQEPGRGILIDTYGRGMAANYYVPMPFSASNREEFRTSTACGLVANVSVAFKVSLGVKVEPIDASLSVQMSGYTSTSQPGCPPINGGGGGGADDPGTKTGVKICYWEIWVDMDGYIVDIVFRGCYSAGGYLT